MNSSMHSMNSTSTVPGMPSTGVNFTKASCSLDASVKIYSYRVDDVHLTSYKVLANLNRTETNQDKKNNKKNNGAADGNDTATADDGAVNERGGSNSGCITKSRGSGDTLEHNTGKRFSILLNVWICSSLVRITLHYVTLRYIRCVSILITMSIPLTMHYFLTHSLSTFFSQPPSPPNVCISLWYDMIGTYIVLCIVHTVLFRFLPAFHFIYADFEILSFLSLSFSPFPSLLTSLFPTL